MWVLNEYVESASRPLSSLKRSAGTIKCKYPNLLQMEQLQSATSSFAGAITSKRTRPQ